MISRSTVELVLVKAPILFLGVMMIAMLFFKVPQDNHDEVLSIVSGFLGLLTGRALTPDPEKPPAQKVTPPPGSGA